MKVAIIADIHSNLPALESVVREIERAGVSMTVCAGDIVGYGANPNECVNATMRLAAHAVRGNHEVSALSNDTSGMNPYAAAASRWTSASLGEVSRRYLARLGIGERFDILDVKAAMYHGSVDSYVEYVYEDRVDETLLGEASADMVILGHTHVPFVKHFSKGLVVNPGSVGQPRDGDPRASFAIFDSETRSCSVSRIDYDIDAAADAITEVGLPAALAERLYRGR
jgi:putative phosphoesterase